MAQLFFKTQWIFCFCVVVLDRGHRVESRDKVATISPIDPEAPAKFSESRKSFSGNETNRMLIDFKTGKKGLKMKDSKVRSGSKKGKTTFVVLASHEPLATCCKPLATKGRNLLAADNFG